MKQHIFVIHGGTAFETYDEYISFLREREVSLEGLQGKDWKTNLQDALGGDYEVYLVKMPNAFNAVYKEWCLWFEKFLPLLNDGVIFVGHSLGAVFLAKYLSEHDVSRKIKATLLVAPPFGRDLGEPLPQFSITEPLIKFSEQGGKIVIFHSKDDPVVDFAELAHYQEQLPEATIKIFENRAHFNMEDFPEIVGEIISIIK